MVSGYRWYLKILKPRIWINVLVPKGKMGVRMFKISLYINYNEEIILNNR